MIAKIRAWLRWHKQRRQWARLSKDARKLVHLMGGFPPAAHWRDAGSHWPKGHELHQSWNKQMLAGMILASTRIGQKESEK